MSEQIYKLTSEEMEVLNFLKSMSDDYPSIERWFIDTVIPGYRHGTRHIVKVERHGKLAGLGIAKKENDEKKICTLRVTDDYIGRGIGYRLLDDMLHWLDDDKPHVTVGAHKMPMFNKMFDRYNFVKSDQKSGMYVPSKIEIGFNGVKL